MTYAVGWLRRVLRRAFLFGLFGMPIGWLFGFYAGLLLYGQAPIVVTDLREAEGVQFSQAETIDLASEVNRTRACPATTQRYLWRWVPYLDGKAQQIIPLADTSLPFLSENGRVILTLPTPRVPEPNAEWFYRSVTQDNCSFLPAMLVNMLGRQMRRSPDVRVNFEESIK